MVRNPGQVGVLTGNVRPRGSERALHVVFPGGNRWVPESQLELVGATEEDPLDLLQRGRLGGASDLRRALTHVRLTGRLADLIYSMESTNTDFYAYQFKPVLKMLNAPNQGLLIADEVGLGKTIEAGLIWTELRSRFDFRRLFVLCPAMLREKWRRELEHRFGVEASVVDARGAMGQLKRTLRNPETTEYAVIGSMQGLRPSATSASARELFGFLEDHAYDEPLIDFLIIDEAHYLKNPESKTSRLGRQLRRNASHVAFLSATPVHLGSQDLFHLLRLLDEDTFSHQGVFDSILQANAPLIKARDAVLGGRVESREFRTHLERAAQHELLSDNRQLHALLAELPDGGVLDDHETRSRLANRLGEMNLLGHAVTRTRKRDVTERRVVREPVPEMIPLSPPERRFYDEVTNLVRSYADRGDGHAGFLLVLPQRQMASSMPAALRSWQQRGRAHFGEQLYEDFGLGNGEDEGEQQMGPLTAELVRRADQLGSVDELWANDSKYARLHAILSHFREEHAGEKVVLFSYFRATLHYLGERLRQDGFDNLVLMGGGDYDKDEILSRFADPEGPPILLSSEVASEGIDLQFSRMLINYDLPWNPMKIEQRIGRIDRIGQKAKKISVWNLFYEDTIDARIYVRLFERLRIFEDTLGAIEPVLGDEIRHLTSDLLKGRLTPEQEERRIDQTAQAMQALQREEEELEREAAHLVAHGDYILNQVEASRRLQRWVSAEDLSSYVIGFYSLHYPGCHFHRVSPEEELYEVALSSEASFDLSEFVRSARMQTSTFLARSGGQSVRCRFDNSVARSTSGLVEVVNHFHPLVRFVSHRLEEADETQYPASAVVLSQEDVGGDVAPGTYVYTLQRWSVSGLQDQEKLDYLALRLDDTPFDGAASDGAAADGAVADLGALETERLIMAAAVKGRDWLQAPNAVDLDRAVDLALNVCQPTHDARFRRFVEGIRNRNQDLADIQEKTLDKHLRRQREMLLRVREDHLRLGRESLAKATEGRLSKLEENVKRKRMAIEKRRDLEYEPRDISVGLIHVT